MQAGIGGLSLAGLDMHELRWWSPCQYVTVFSLHSWSQGSACNQPEQLETRPVAMPHVLTTAKSEHQAGIWASSWRVAFQLGVMLAFYGGTNVMQVS